MPPIRTATEQINSPSHLGADDNASLSTNSANGSANLENFAPDEIQGNSNTAWQEIAADIWSDKKELPPGLDTFMKNTEAEKLTADSLDHSNLLRTLHTGVESKIDLTDRIEQSRNGGTSDSALENQFVSQDRANWETYKQYLSPATS
ncbi:MAG: hypothetical protein K8F91_14515, partial [Candidatus Obscuribacterales bacterium]|nr:hypothetical protein [Candidatus Obscuribacterales bacterium]